MTRRLQSLNNWHVFYILILITFFTSLTSGIINPDKADMAWWSGFLQNFSTEMMGAIATFALFELVVGSRNEKKNLIIQMRSSDKASAVTAIAQLRANGWLEDGSLNGADLQIANLLSANLWQANLSGAFLYKANLEGANLEDANLEGANLMTANLSSANLMTANLQGAFLWDANLEGADLADTNLEGANLTNANLNHANMYNVQCNENTELPDSTMWTMDVDWSKYGAVVLDISQLYAYRIVQRLDKDE